MRDYKRSKPKGKCIGIFGLHYKAPYYWFAGTFLTSIGLGCLGGSVIVAVSQVVPAHPPAHRLIGKSPEYVITYTSTYEKETKSKRLLHTFTGCVGGSAIAGLIEIYLYSETY